MTKSVLLATAAVFAMSAGIASAAGTHPSATTAGSHVKAQPLKAHGPAGVLYDQNNNDGGIGIVSQNFEVTFDAYDAQPADDFVVPEGHKWKVSEVDVTGVYFNGSGPAVSENVTFYKDKGGHPGKVVAEYDGVAGVDSFGSFAISIPKTKLKAGHYWVAVQANLDFQAGGEWGWENQSTSEGTATQWENPGDGFATGCTTWAQENVCIPDGQGDHMFALRGKDAVL